MTLPAGKLPAEMLRALLASLPAADPSVIVGGAIGEDAAVLDTGGPDLLVAKTDPITFAGGDIGHYLVAVNSNDLATMGAEPRWLLVTALLPEGAARELVVTTFDSLRSACTDAGIALVGGHTEITVGLDQPILVGCLLGTVARDRLVRTGGAEIGDAIVLAGAIAVEGTAILAREHAGVLRDRGVSSETVDRAANLLHDPGISVLPAARAAHVSRAVHSMHDPTEGGLMTALHEVADAAEVGLRIHRRGIPILPECALICEALHLDPLGLIASGALLIALDPGDLPAALGRLRAAGIPAAHIGEVVPVAEGRVLVDENGDKPLPRFERDELARYLEQRDRQQAEK